MTSTRSARPSTTATSAFTPRDAGLLILLALFWGNSFLFIKLAVEHMAPLWVVAGRLSIGGLLLLGLAAARRQALPRDRKIIAILAIIGAVGTGGGWLLQAWAQQQLDSGLVAVLNSTTPVATLVVAVAVGQEQLHGRRILGLGVAVVGTLVVIGGEVSAGGPVLALSAAVLATLGYAGAGVLTRQRISGNVRAIPAAAMQLVTAAVLFNLLGVALEGAPPAVTELAPIAVVALLALGILGTGTAFIIFFTLIERVGATNASMVTYLVPIVGLVSGALFLGERFGANVFVGAAVLIAGVYVAQRSPAS